MSAIIFDFDGTIADSFPYVSDFLAREAGKAQLSADRRSELRGLSMAGMARALGFSWLHLPLLFLRGRREMQRSMKHLEPFDGMPEIIKKLHGEGHELFIVSTNTVRNVRKFLHHHELHKYFLEIYGGVVLFGKAPALRQVLRQHNVPAADAVYIGDELRDVQAAQSINLRVIAVTWGFARQQDLEEQQPTAVAHSPDELLEVLNQL